MKVLLVTNHFSPCLGGIERVVLDSAEYLKEKGQSPEVVCLNRCARSAEKLNSEGSVNGVPVHRLKFLDLHYYKVAFGILKHAKKSDIVHVHGIGFLSDFLLFSKFLHRKSVVVSTHGGIFHTKKLGLLKWLYFFGCQRIMLRLADRIFAVSESDLELFSKIVPRKKIVLVRNGIKIPPEKKPEKKENTYLYVGRLSKNKRLDLMLSCFSFLKKKDTSFNLAIVGKEFDVCVRELQDRAKALGISENVSILGPVSQKELVGYMRTSRFFVSSSEYEGFGLSAVEAMSYGCIPLLSNIPSFNEFVSGIPGVDTIDFSSPDSASDAILSICGGNDLDILSMSAVSASKDYSVENSMGLLFSEYEGILG